MSERVRVRERASERDKAEEEKATPEILHHRPDSQVRRPRDTNDLPGSFSYRQVSVRPFLWKLKAVCFGTFSFSATTDKLCVT